MVEIKDPSKHEVRQTENVFFTGSTSSGKTLGEIVRTFQLLRAYQEWLHCIFGNTPVFDDGSEDGFSNFFKGMQPARNPDVPDELFNSVPLNVCRIYIENEDIPKYPNSQVFVDPDFGTNYVYKWRLHRYWNYFEYWTQMPKIRNAVMILDEIGKAGLSGRGYNEEQQKIKNMI